MVHVSAVSSLTKVFPFDDYPEDGVKTISRFANEPVAFQVVVTEDRLRKRKIFLEQEGAARAAVREVKLVPCFMGQNFESDCDDYYLIKDRPSTYYPDVLQEVKGYSILTKGQKKSFWISVRSAPVGTVGLTVRVRDYKDGTELGAISVNIVTHGCELPELNIPYTCWFYYDCLADYYGVEPFGKEFESILKNYTDNAVAHGINTILVPLFGQQADVAGENKGRCVQLVDVKTDGENYEFDFGRMLKFMDFAKSRGIRYFEFSHLASQWDVDRAVFVKAETADGEKYIFTRESASIGEAYTRFLRACLTELRRILEEEGYKDKAFFHIADEPIIEAIDYYETLHKVVKDCVGDCPIIDAVAKTEYVERKLMDCYVPSTDVAEDFQKMGVPCWVYYCYCQADHYLSNRTLNMPSLRNRILGMQLYKNSVKGFLHWGYNFWFDSNSERMLDPYFETDADNNYSGGDAYLVYPGKNGEPVDSVRQEVFYEGINDYRALTLLENLYGKEFVSELLEKEGIKGFGTYPHSEKWHHEFREKINTLIIGKWDRERS